MIRWGKLIKYALNMTKENHTNFFKNVNSYNFTAFTYRNLSY